MQCVAELGMVGLFVRRDADEGRFDASRYGSQPIVAIGISIWI